MRAATRYLRVNIAFVFAGITTGVLDLLNNKSLTFLRRAKSEELASIPLDEVAESLRLTIERSGLHIGEVALHKAAEATEGYAYLTQLVGYNVWKVARRHAVTLAEITADDVARGVMAANKEYESAVLDTALIDLTRPAIEYLYAMCEDPVASATGDTQRAWASGRGMPTHTAASSSPVRLSKPPQQGTLRFDARMRTYLVGKTASASWRGLADSSAGHRPARAFISVCS